MFLKKIYNKLPLRIRVGFQSYRALLNVRDMKKKLHEVTAAYNEYRLGGYKEYIEIKEPEEWLRTIRKALRTPAFSIESGTEFFCAHISKRKECAMDNEAPILVCLIKDDIYKLPYLLAHYRKLGVKNFVFIDNLSTDGTYEALMAEPGINVLCAETPYSTNKREGWINRVMAHYGYNKWYIVVDSDELLTYNGMEQHSINDLIAYAENNKLVRMRALMVDMYPKGDLLNYNEQESYFAQCSYFDSNSYFENETDIVDAVKGGPRGKLFNENAFLTKYPVLFLKHGHMQLRSHLLFPLFFNKRTTCHLALRHYKFFPNDMKKYKERLEQGTFFKGSSQYRNYFKYVESGSVLCAYDGQSREYTCSNDLYVIDQMKKITWR